MDPSAAPQLTTIRHNGRRRDVVAVTAKTGWLYVFDRVTGEPIWPTNPPPYIKHTFDVDDISPYLVADRAAALRTRLLAADNKGIFTPLSTKETVSVPASNGGTLFGGAAAEPRTGAVYVVARQRGHRKAAASRRRQRRRWSSHAAGGDRLPAELPDVPRRQPAGHRYRCAARACRRRCGEQHRCRRAQVRCGRDSRGYWQPARTACRRSPISGPRMSTTSWAS